MPVGPSQMLFGSKKCIQRCLARPHGMTAGPGLRSYRASSGRSLNLLFFLRARDAFSVLAAISSYELRLRCSLTRWTRMDEGYNTMVFNIHFDMMKKSPFPTPHMAKSGGYNSSILHPFDFFFSGFISYSSFEPKYNQSQGKPNKILPKLLNVQSSYENR